MEKEKELEKKKVQMEKELEEQKNLKMEELKRKMEIHLEKELEKKKKIRIEKELEEQKNLKMEELKRKMKIHLEKELEKKKKIRMDKELEEEKKLETRAADSSVLKHPKCVIKLTATSKKSPALVIPENCAKKLGLPRESCTINLKDKDENCWPAQIIYDNVDSEFRIGCGWSLFRSEHKLKVRDYLFLQYIQNEDPPVIKIQSRQEHRAPGVAKESVSADRSSYKQSKLLPSHLRWPHMQADQVHGLGLREIGGFVKHHRAPSIRSTCYTIAKPLTMVQKMQNIKMCKGHRDAVYCAIFDRSGRYVITGSDDKLVKIWSMETAFCLASCRGHEGDITDLAVSSNNAVVASAANDFVIRVWHLPDGLPFSVLQGHTGAVTAIAFSPRPSAVFQLLSSSDDGTCRIWDARSSHCTPRIYVPKPSNNVAGRDNVPSSTGPSSSNGLQSNQILCCAYNANGTVFVTGSSDTLVRVWSACKASPDESDQLIHEIDVLSGHENDVNYVQFSGCAAASRSSLPDTLKEDRVPKFKNTWFCHDNIVTCSRDGSAIIWAPISRRSHGKSLRWTKLYHLKVPPPPLPPQPPRGGPRERILPRGVNMIVWSLDNRFVLAAIADCRICVWNAADSSLVHSLTGHTACSHVLDVHPFNPRIAMSAGYDGRTIVWDIWEGIPIQVYEIELGLFKLLDGKFSPDGTSIVLSDDVGQIHLINTGQGESQKDAKYDQFFLGDYRPVIRDAAGNVLDQESQLPPHRRNLQDPLCDSSLIPYPEPYQTMFQQRRLGALGVEWRPPSIKFAVGPDFSLGLDYQMPPLEDLDRMIEPLPEFLDAIFREPESEIISDDADSEYNLAEDGISEGEQGSVCYISPSDSDCSIEDSDIDHDQEDGLRRSQKKTQN